MKDKIAEIDGRLDSTGRVSDPGNVDYYQEAFANFNIAPEDINYDNTLDFYVVEDGELVRGNHGQNKCSRIRCNRD